MMRGTRPRPAGRSAPGGGYSQLVSGSPDGPGWATGTGRAKVTPDRPVLIRSNARGAAPGRCETRLSTPFSVRRDRARFGVDASQAAPGWSWNRDDEDAGEASPDCVLTLTVSTAPSGVETCSQSRRGASFQR